MHTTWWCYNEWGECTFSGNKRWQLVWFWTFLPHNNCTFWSASHSAMLCSVLQYSNKALHRRAGTVSGEWSSTFNGISIVRTACQSECRVSEAEPTSTEQTHAMILSAIRISRYDNLRIIQQYAALYGTAWSRPLGIMLIVIILNFIYLREVTLFNGVYRLHQFK